MTTEVEDDAHLVLTFSFHNMNAQDKEAHQNQIFAVVRASTKIETTFPRQGASKRIRQGFRQGKLKPGPHLLSHGNFRRSARLKEVNDGFRQGKPGP